MTVRGGILGLLVYILLFGWWVLYAVPCILNHFGVWPFSLIGQG
jgi:hypothetical protein